MNITEAARRVLEALQALVAAHGIPVTELEKAATHKYIKKVPKPGGGWRYYYQVHHGRHVHHEDDMVQHAAFGITHEGKKGHFHIVEVKGDELILEHDESGKRLPVSKEGLRDLLRSEYGEQIERLRAKYVGAKAPGVGAAKAAFERARTKAAEVIAAHDAPEEERKKRREKLLADLAAAKTENEALKEKRAASAKPPEQPKPETSAKPDEERARKLAEAKAKLAAAREAHRARQAAEAEAAKQKEEAPKDEPKPTVEEAAQKLQGVASVDSDKLERVGDHIWGSRKDLAALGEITSSQQLEGMSTDDAAVIVRKSKLIPALSLSEMKAMGMSPGVAHMTTALMAAIVAKPADSRAARAQYVDAVREIIGALPRLKSLEEFREFLSEMNQRRRRAKEWEPVETLSNVGGYMGQRMDRAAISARIAELEKDNPGVQFRATMDYGNYGVSIVRKALRPYDALGARFTKFLTRGGELFKEAYVTALTVDGEWSYSRDRSTASGEGAKLTPEQGWAYLEASTQKAKEKAAEKPRPQSTKGQTERGHSEAKRRSSTVRRIGGKEIGEANPDRARKTFNFREIDFGEYLTQADREFHAKALEEAMHDLADAVGLPPTTISFQGRLGVALGARGRGGKAAAHYEPDRKAINITKFRGGGSVAHEWGHAMDNIVSEHYVKRDEKTAIGKAFLTKMPEHSALPEDVSTAVRGVLDALRKAPDPVEARRKHRENLDAAGERASSLVKENNELVKEHNALFKKTKAEQADRMVPAWERNIEGWKKEIAEFKEKIQKRPQSQGRFGDKRQAEIGHREFWIKNTEAKIAAVKSGTGIQTDADRQRMDEIKARIEEIRIPMNRATAEQAKLQKMDPERSEYLSSAVELGSYWSSEVEMFARAFETYVAGKLKESGRRNTYLVDDEAHGHQAYPQGKEREHIARAFDRFMEVMRRGGHIEKAIQSAFGAPLEGDMEKASTKLRNFLEGLRGREPGIPGGVRGSIEASGGGSESGDSTALTDNKPAGEPDPPGAAANDLPHHGAPPPLGKEAAIGALAPQGQLTGGVPMLAEELVALEKALGPRHPDVISKKQHLLQQIQLGGQSLVKGFALGGSLPLEVRPGFATPPVVLQPQAPQPVWQRGRLVVDTNADEMLSKAIEEGRASSLHIRGHQGVGGTHAEPLVGHQVGLGTPTAALPPAQRPPVEIRGFRLGG